MKIFKFIRKLFADFCYWLRYSWFYEGLFFIVIMSALVSITALLGFVVDLLGIPCGNADHVMAKGLLAILVIIITSIIGVAIWSFYHVSKHAIVSACAYLKKTWKEL